MPQLLGEDILHFCPSSLPLISFNCTFLDKLGCVLLESTKMLMLILGTQLPTFSQYL